MRCLVIGTGRCGTLYAAKYLQALGLDVPHEKMGRDGTSNWWLGVPWEMYPTPKFDRVLHIYREPLATISSLTTCGPQHEFWQHSIQNSPVQASDPVLVRAMKHWLYWNSMCELIADKSLAIEHWDTDWIEDFFQVTDTQPAIPKDTHTWKGRFIERTWMDLKDMEPDITRLIRRKARRYGYEIPYEADFDCC